MCIICNVTIGAIGESMDNAELASAFLHEFSIAQQHMKLAAEKLLQVSKINGLDPVVSEQYDVVHKDMVRLIREWNKLEEKREKATPPHPDAAGQAST